jgi:hypothetical protein
MCLKLDTWHHTTIGYSHPNDHRRVQMAAKKKKAAKKKATKKKAAKKKK